MKFTVVFRIPVISTKILEEKLPSCFLACQINCHEYIRSFTSAMCANAVGNVLNVDCVQMFVV